MSLLDGLEISELMLSDVFEDNDSFRLDSEYYKKALIKFYKNIENFDKLETFVESGYRVVYENTKIIDVPKDKEHLYTRFLQASDVYTPEITLDNVGFVTNADWERYPKGRIEEGELLIEVKGKAEKVAIVYDNIPPKTLVSGSLFKLKSNNKATKEYLLTFLLCKYGAMFKNRSKTNLLISYISKPDLYNIPIPLVSQNFQSNITKLIKLSHQKLEESKILYQQTQNILLEKLDLLDFTPTNLDSSNRAGVSIKNFSESFGSSGRLDSEYYQAKYDEIINHIRKASYDRLENIVHVIKSIEPGSNAYQEDGIPFVRVSNLSKFEITQPDIYLSPNLLDEEELELLQPKKNTILFSKDGTVGIAYNVKEDSKFITSGALLHLTIKQDYLQKVRPEYLTLVLNSLVVQLQSERDAGGSIIKHWKPSEIKEVLVPVIDYSIQTRIEEKVQESFRLKEQSKQLLEIAKKAVEIAIEQNEDAALSFIDTKGIL